MPNTVVSEVQEARSNHTLLHLCLLDYKQKPIIKCKASISDKNESEQSLKRRIILKVRVSMATLTWTTCYNK